MQFGAEVIKQVSQTKFLGLQIHENLSWTAHIETIGAELSKKLYMMNSVKRFIPFQSRKTLYYSFFHSKLDASMLIWGLNGKKSDLKRLKVQQNKAIRAIKLLKYDDSVRKCYKELKVLDIKNLVIFNLAKFMYKVKYDLSPKPILDIYSVYNHTYETLHKHNPLYLECANFSSEELVLYAKAQNYGVKFHLKLEIAAR